VGYDTPNPLFGGFGHCGNFEYWTMFCQEESKKKPEKKLSEIPV
jgi:hypothetical protein